MHHVDGLVARLVVVVDAGKVVVVPLHVGVLITAAGEGESVRVNMRVTCPLGSTAPAHRTNASASQPPPHLADIQVRHAERPTHPVQPSMLWGSPTFFVRSFWSTMVARNSSFSSAPALHVSRPLLAPILSPYTFPEEQSLLDPATHSSAGLGLTCDSEPRQCTR